MLRWRVILPFVLTGTIWGSTWFVITGQIDGVPAAWSVFYRFALATPALFCVALVMKRRLRLTGPEQRLAVLVGLFQFSGNFLFVYHAELYVTSGIVAMMFALLMLGFPMMVPLSAAFLFMMFTGMTFFGPDQGISWMISGISTWVLAAVPMFIFAADIMTKGHTANRLLDLVSAFTGHLRGGLPITTATSCALFGAVSGSTQATVVAMGGPMRPRLLERGY
ncbi:MAG: TRAP transporter large permease subunit, partial [Erythrobacter sp.]